MNRCGARLRGERAGLFCRQRPEPGRRRCRFHGGRLRGWSGPRSPAHRAALWAGRALRQAERRALGLPWYGARLSVKGVLAVSDKAIEIADQALAAVRGEEGARLPTLLREGMDAGLELGKDTVIGVAGKLRERGGDVEAVDIGLLRLGNETGMALCRLGMRAIEGEFQARKLDKLGELIEAVRAQEKPPTEG